MRLISKCVASCIFEVLTGIWYLTNRNGPVSRYRLKMEFIKPLRILTLPGLLVFVSSTYVGHVPQWSGDRYLLNINSTN